jgi:hypothetical protein
MDLTPELFIWVLPIHLEDTGSSHMGNTVQKSHQGHAKLLDGMETLAGH